MTATLNHHDIGALIKGGTIIEAGRAKLACEWHLNETGATEGRFVMTGPSGGHSLMIIATDIDRLNAHWSGFAADPRNAA